MMSQLSQLNKDKCHENGNLRPYIPTYDLSYYHIKLGIAAACLIMKITVEIGEYILN